MGCKFENWLDESVALKYYIFAYFNCCCIICVACSQDIGSSSSVCGPATRGIQTREKGEDLERLGGDGYTCTSVKI